MRCAERGTSGRRLGYGGRRQGSFSICGKPLKRVKTMNDDRITFVAASHPEADERALVTTTTQTPAAVKRTVYPADEELRGRLREFIESSGGRITQASVARDCGVSRGLLSQYLAPEGNLYNGDTAAQETLFREFLRDNWTLSDTGVTTVETPVVKQVEAAIEDARVAGRLVIIIGEPGIGKSRAISHYVQEHKRAVAFEAWGGEYTIRHLVDLLWESAAVMRGDTSNRVRVLVDRLRDSGRTIIVDDAHKLSAQALQLLVEIRDKTRVGVVLVGTAKLEPKMYADSQRASRTQVVHRLKVRAPRKLVEHHIEQLLGKDAEEEREDLIELGVRIAEADGHFRSLQLDLAFARKVKKGTPSLSWCAAVKAAHASMLRRAAMN